jgi:hypothetical protein
MVSPLFRVSNNIIKISLDNLLDIMECIRYLPLKSGSNIFKAEGHFLIGEGTPKTNESCLMLIFGFHLNLVVAEESIHE